MKKLTTLTLMVLICGAVWGQNTNKIGSTGNVGIGTTSPTLKLEIKKHNNVATAWMPNLLLNNGWGGIGSEGLRIRSGDDVLNYDIFSFNHVVPSASYLGFLVSEGNAADEFKPRDAQMVIMRSGKVGIGTTTPSAKFEVAGNIKAQDITSGNIRISQVSKTAALEVEQGKSISGLSSYDVGGCMYLKDNRGNMRVVFRGFDNPAGSVIDGKLSIGKNTAPNATLDVNGSIKAHEIAVTLASIDDMQLNGTLAANNITYTANGNTADFVFEDNYKLKDLTEVEAFIKTNKHLPEIPSADEMEESGVNLAEMNKLLLMKVEELTLYSIQLEKEVKEVRSTESEVRRELSQLKTEMDAIKEFITNVNNQK